MALLATHRAKTIAVPASNQFSAVRRQAGDGAREMTLPGPPCAFWFAIRIDVQNKTCDFAPIGPFSVSVKQTQIRYEMLFIVAG